MKPLPSSSTYAFWLAIVRIVVGAVWIAHALPKFLTSDQFMPPNGFMSSLITKGAQEGSPFYRPFLTNVVIPNASIFAELVRVGELLTGVALVLGLFTRLGGFTGMFLTFNYMSAKGAIFSTETLAGNDFAMFLLSAINLVLPTGRALGIDALLARRKRSADTVRAEFVPEPPPTGPSAPTEP